MAGGQEKWYFTKEQLQNSPSRKCGLDADKELAYRQQAANLIQDMGQRLQVSQLCINTAIVYMHRFYAFHSFTQFHRNAIAAAALFLAAKVEEQPRKLEYVIKVAHVCLHRGEGVNNLTSETYQEQAQDLVFNENVLLQTLGFDVAIDHPHTHVVRTCHLVKAPKDLAQTSYFMASNSLHLTTMCLQYKPTVVACFCIHLASKWSNWSIPQSNEGRHWFSYVDRTVTVELLEKLTSEFLLIFEKCPSRLKRKMMNVKADGSSPHSGAHPSQATLPSTSAKHPPPPDDFDKSFDKEYERERRRQPVPGGYVPATTAPQSQPQKIDYNLYREKREREERERREEREKQRQLAMQQRHGPTGAPAPPRPAAPHHQRPPHHHGKVHHPWPNKHHQKPPHDHRHHRPHPGQSQNPNPSQSQSQPASSQAQPQNPPAPQSQPVQSQPIQEVPQRTRPPSLFSPENVTTPTVAAQSAPRRPVQPIPSARPKELRPQPQETQRPPSPKKRPDPSTAIREMQPPAILSPFNSPPTIKQEKKQRQQSTSEPELVISLLVPVVKKLDETPGYQNLIKDSQKTHTKVKQESKTDSRVNGIETDPTLVSNLLKESLVKPVPITVPTEKKSPLIEVKKEVETKPQTAPPVQQIIQPIQETPVAQEETTKHKKEKKKKDKHKHKDRDKSKEERKKHKKDKEKEKKEKEQPAQQTEQVQDGIRITIPRDKLSTSPGLKIKIPKERLAAPPPPPQTSGLKIKISKEVLETSRKRVGVQDQGPPQKIQRQNGAHPKVGWINNMNNMPPYRPPMPYFMMQPPPMYFNGYYYPNMDGFMYPPPAIRPPPPKQPPLPAMPPPPVPPPPPE